jgi:nucleotide-binding universal stress UspA family protein
VIKRVLLAVDDSAASLAAARMAAELCAGWGATLHVVTAASDEPPHSAGAGASRNHGSHEARVREAQALLRYVAPESSSPLSKSSKPDTSSSACSPTSASHSSCCA